VSRNNWLKTASVAIAIVMWFSVVTRGQSTLTLEVPVNFANLTDNLRIVGDGDRFVTIELRGHERFLRKLSPDDISVVLDLTGVSHGTHVLEVARESVLLASPLRVMSISPSAFNIKVEKTALKTVPVRTVVTGLPAKGYAVRSIEVLPGEVEVRGAGSEIKLLRWLYTRAVDVSGATENVSAEVELDTDTLTTETGKVKVNVIIIKERK
jgi:YbbR domain-containing protein